VVVMGELDIASVDRLWAAIEETIRSDRPLILDMGRVTFFGAQGVRLLRRTPDRVVRAGACSRGGDRG